MITRVCPESKKKFQERVTGLQRAVTQLAAEKQNEHDLFKKHARDAKQLRKNVDEAEKDRLANDRNMVKLVEDKAVLEQRLHTANTEIKDLKDLCAVSLCSYLLWIMLKFKFFELET